MNKSVKSNDLQNSKSYNQKQAFNFPVNKDFTPNAFSERDVNSSSNAILKFKTGNIQNSSSFAFTHF